jgi:hypothetical protein
MISLCNPEALPSNLRVIGHKHLRLLYGFQSFLAQQVQESAATSQAVRLQEEADLAPIVQNSNLIQDGEHLDQAGQAAVFHKLPNWKTKSPLFFGSPAQNRSRVVLVDYGWLGQAQVKSQPWVVHVGPMNCGLNPGLFRRDMTILARRFNAGLIRRGVSSRRDE